MGRKLFTIALAIGLLTTFALPALGAKVSGARTGGTPLVATLTGDAERPGPGDPDGSGTALITVNFGQRQVCWELTHEDIARPTAAHIHVAPPTDPGPIVVHLDPHAPGCTTADGALIKALRSRPGDYYVNIHNADFPGGAIRGQLARR